MGLKLAIFVGGVTVLILAGCGGGGDTTSTTATGTGAANASTATTATAGIASRVLANNELKGFTGSSTKVAKTISAWLAATQTPSQDVASETKRLTRQGFVTGAHEDLIGSGGGGASIAEQFKTPAGARAELADVVKLFEAGGRGPATFPVPGIPGAVGLAASGAENVAFTSGGYYYLVGALVPVNAHSKATLVAAAKHLYGRVHG